MTSQDSARRAAARLGQTNSAGEQAKRFISQAERDARRAATDASLKLSGRYIDKIGALGLRSEGATYANIASVYKTTPSAVAKFFARIGDANPEIRRILAKKRPSRNDVKFKAWVALCGGNPAKLMAEQEAQIRRDFATLIKAALSVNSFGARELARRVGYQPRTIWRFLNEPITSGSFPVNKMAKIAVALGCRLRLELEPLPDGDWEAHKKYISLIARPETDERKMPNG